MPVKDQGINHSDYCVIPRTLVFIFNDFDQVLLLKGAPEKRLWAGLYNGIGGHVEPGEDIYKAALREVGEETGIGNIDLEFCGQVMIDVTQRKGVAIFIFRGQYKGEPLVASPEGEIIWIDLHSLENVPLVEDLFDLIPLVASYQPTDPVLIGVYHYDQDGKLHSSFRGVSSEK